MREAEIRAADPLLGAYRRLTPRQRSFVDSLNREKVAEGGNQSGKTWSGSVDFLMDAAGNHPTRIWPPPGSVEQPGGWGNWKGWFATTTFDKFGEQAWGHFKRLLLYPGEQFIPGKTRATRRIVQIGWHSKYPEVPEFMQIKRDQGGLSDVWIKSYEQAVAEFAAAELDKLQLDEECPEAIYNEAQPRILKRKGQISVTATPVLGVKWLARLRRHAMTGSADVHHSRFPTKENPSIDLADIHKLEASYAHCPEMLKMRLEGYPVSMEGVVYNDEIFTPAHVIRDRFVIPPHWTRFRWIDPGWRNCGCLWFAVSPKEEDIICYRDYLGHSKTIGENAAQIRRMSGGEHYGKTWIDRYYVEKHEELSGQRILDLWRKEGIDCIKSADIGVMPAIENVWKLLKERSGPSGERPRFRVMSWCSHFLEEREAYHWPEVSERETTNEKMENPVAKDNHLMDCWKGFIACRPRWIPPAAPMPPKGTDGYMLWEERRKALEDDGGS